MLNKHKESIVQRLLTGQQIFDVAGVLYRLMPPEIAVIHRADIAYEAAIKSNRFEQWLSESECIRVLFSRNLCSLDIDKELKEIENRTEDLKVSLFESYINPKESTRIRKELGMVKSLLNTKTAIRHSLDHLTLKGYAEMIRQQCITIFSLYFVDKGQQVWTSEDCVDMKLLERIMSKQQESMLDVTDIRELARSDLWRSYFGTSNKYPFSIPVYQLNNEQRTLIMFTNMYDSIHQSVDCPAEDVINDDDLLDGWLIRERRQREKERNKKEIESKVSDKMKGAQDISLPAKTKEQAAKINQLNDIEGQIIKNQRLKQIKAKGKITDAEFADKKLDIRMAQNQQFMNHVRGS